MNLTNKGPLATRLVGFLTLTFYFLTKKRSERMLLNLVIRFLLLY